MEERYKFRKELTTANFPIKYQRRDIGESEVSLLGGVIFTGEDNVVITHAKSDMDDFLKTAFGIKGSDNPLVIDITITDRGLEDVCGYKGRITEIAENGISIKAFDERGAAQALYDLEDMMKEAKQPFLPICRFKNKPLFSPRMVHSAYAMDIYPAGYLQRLSKEGIDAIMLTATDINKVMSGDRDINAITDLAAEYGIDVYAYWSKPLFYSPEAEDAEEVYDKAYGEFFKAHNKVKGVILVGESINFPSKDERTTGRPYWECNDEDGLRDPRPSVSHFPCRDYPVWLNLVKKVIRRQKADADIVFWTYNWGFTAEKERLELIDSLPTDISLMATFEMFEELPTKYGITEKVCDYSVAFSGPGEYFLSEAKAAKKRGIRLYTQANSGGRTWDFGCMPFEPFPSQWLRRYDEMVRCNKEYGLVGVMESHQYGFTPSMITEIEKRAFNVYRKSSNEILSSVIDSFSEGQTNECMKALEYWSEAIRLYMPTDHEQYCAMRVGPAYPLTLEYFVNPPTSLMPEGCVVPRGFTLEYGRATPMLFEEGKFTLHSIRIRAEIKILRDMIKLLKKGLSIFRALPRKNEEIRKLMNMGQYMVCCFTTDIHVKQLFILKHKLMIAATKKEVRKIIDGIRKIGNAEIKNAERALVCVDRDSALGFEPLMGYAGDRAHIEWKIRQVMHMMNYELGLYEKGLEY